jgi:L-amino acid N-acyltransferase YncA
VAALIRLATERDAAAVRTIYAPVVTQTATSFEFEPPNVDELRSRIAKTLDRFPWIVCDRAGTVLGYAYAGPHRERAAYQWSVEVSVYIDEGARRSGIGRALYTSLFALLRLQGFHNAYAGVTLPNAASVALHESLGFRPVGVYRRVGHKVGAWHDVGWWSLAIGDHTPSPTLPLAMADARRSPEWDSAMRAGESLLRV